MWLFMWHQAGYSRGFINHSAFFFPSLGLGIMYGPFEVYMNFIGVYLIGPVTKGLIPQQ